jgi:hypothetical protein
MITQIIIKEDQDFGISNNYGDVEPFNSALKAQLFNHVSLIDYMSSLNGFDTSLAKKRLLKNHIRKYWNNLPYQKFIIRNTVTEFLFHIFNKPKNIF